MGRGIGQQAVKALIHHQPRAAHHAAVQNLPEECRVCGHAGGVIGLAEEDHINVRSDLREEFLGQAELILRMEENLPHRATDPPEGGGILREGRRGHQGQPGPNCLDRPLDQVPRPVAAEDPIRWDLPRISNGFPQVPAEGVRVAVRLVQGPNHRLPDALGQSQGADVGGKVQGKSAVGSVKACPVAAVVVWHGFLPLSVKTGNGI